MDTEHRLVGAPGRGYPASTGGKFTQWTVLAEAGVGTATLNPTNKAIRPSKEDISPSLRHMILSKIRGEPTHERGERLVVDITATVLPFLRGSRQATLRRHHRPTPSPPACRIVGSCYSRYR